MTIIEELQAAADEVEKQRKLVEAEMVEKGSRGKLWQNGMCKAWPAYEYAIYKQNEVRRKHGC
jgi:hypothetical protein